MGAKKVFENGSESLIIDESVNPWTIDNLIYLDLEIWKALVIFTSKFSPKDAEYLEDCGTSAFTDDINNHKLENLLSFDRILRQCISRIRSEPKLFQDVLDDLQTENPLIVEEYIRICEIFLKFIGECVKRRTFYYAWTE